MLMRYFRAAPDIQTVDSKNAKEWKVSFNSPAAKARSKEMLCDSLTKTGNCIAANYTGR